MDITEEPEIAEEPEKAEEPEIQAPAPSNVPMDTIYEYVPVTSFIHTVKIERSRHSFHSADENTIPYENAHFDSSASNDSTVAFSVKNVLGIALLEGFNKYAKAGLTAYISHKMDHYSLMNPDTTLLNPQSQTYKEQEVFVGGELAKRAGSPKPPA